MNEDLVLRAQQLIIELEEESLSTATVKAVSKLLAAVYVDSLAEENKLQILSIFNTVEKKLIELITLHGSSKIRILLRSLLFPIAGKVPQSLNDSAELEVDVELGANLFNTLHEINAKLRRMRMYAENPPVFPEPPPEEPTKLVLPTIETDTNLSEVQSPSDLLSPKWREGFDSGIPANFQEVIDQVHQVMEVARNTSFQDRKTFEDKKSAFLATGMFEKIESPNIKRIEESLDALFDFLSDYILTCLAGVTANEENYARCRSFVRDGFNDLVDLYDLPSIALATAAELRESVFPPDIPPRACGEVGEPWIVTNHKAHWAVYQMLNQCSSQMRKN